MDSQVPPQLPLVPAVIAIIATTTLLLFLGLRHRRTKWQNLPPAPPGLPVFGHICSLLSRTKDGFSAFEELVRNSRQRYGKIFTLWIFDTPLILVTDRALAHDALIQKGAVFASRPRPRGFRKIFSADAHSINSAPYGVLWRALRTNLSGGILAGSAAFAPVRDWAIGLMLDSLARDPDRSGAVRLREHMRDAVLRIVITMCVGDRPDDAALRAACASSDALIDSNLLLNENILTSLLPWRRRLARRMLRLRRDALLPLVCAARAPSYVATLRELRIHEGRHVKEEEMITLCQEFLIAGTDTTVTVLEWALANVVRLPEVRRRLHEEIDGMCGDAEWPSEEDIRRMRYLQAVVMETLRRHPPGHFVLNHTVTRPAELAGFAVPPEALVNFDVFGMAMDPDTWHSPEEFRPERFLSEATADELGSVLTGVKGIKMMPFGVGRRICPGMSLALLHVSLFLARILWRFELDEVEGERVDLSEALHLTTVMKHPLRARLSDRRRKSASSASSAVV